MFQKTIITNPIYSLPWKEMPEYSWCDAIALQLLIVGFLFSAAGETILQSEKSRITE